MTTPVPDFSLESPTLPIGRLVIEASAGTGKTYSLSGLVARHVIERGVTASQLLVVTFTRAAAAELRDRTRAALVAARGALESGVPPADHGWMHVLLHADEHEMQLRRERVHDAIAEFDDATITTIHGFCQLALRQLGQQSGVSLDAEMRENSRELIDEVCRDVVVARLLRDRDALAWKGAMGKPGSVFTELKSTVATVLGNPGAALLPDESVPPKASTAAGMDHLDGWLDAVREACAEVRRRRAERQELGFDDLIGSMAAAVERDEVCEMLQDRYRLALVDEFQDTDPLQWRIFDRAFEDRLVTVGDPKQAIYRFRGADVHAYLDAVTNGDKVQLGTNFRSDAQLVAATNALLDGVHLGHEQIVVNPVVARPGAPERSVPHGAPIELRWLPDHPDLQTEKGALSAPLVRRSIVADLVAEVVTMLQHHRITPKKGGERGVQPGDIAVLVHTHAQASEVAAALLRAGVPAVRTRTGSVLDSPAAVDWATLLAALERPSHAPTVRAAGLGVFLHAELELLDPRHPMSGDTLAELQRRCAQWADRMGSRSFLAWYDEVRNDSGVLAGVLGRQGGERLLTDLDHIAELLATELSGAGATPALAARVLARLQADAEAAGDSEEQMRRIDSDEQAVQISTIHSSKGLQYPIVLLPLSWTTQDDRGPQVFRDPLLPRRVINIASKFGWSGTDVNYHVNARDMYTKRESRGDALRLLYVALTRAEHRTILWWAPVSGNTRNALNAVLFDRGEDLSPLNNTERGEPGTRGGYTAHDLEIDVPTQNDDARARLARLVEHSNGLIALDEVATFPKPGRWVPPAPTVATEALAAADAGSRTVHDPAWKRWSFTSITRTRDHVWVPRGGGLDEPDDDDSGSSLDDAAVRGITVPLADVVAGKDFGTLVHSVLELVDPAHPDLEERLREVVADQQRRSGLVVSSSVLTSGLLATIETSLGPIADGRALRDIPASDRLAELEFDLPLGTEGGAVRASARQIGDVLLATLPADDPQRDYAQQLAEGRYDVKLAGYLQGSIDAVLRVPDPAVGHRFVVVDYKTNRLHARGAAVPLAAYHPSQLPAAMAEHDYPLQSILYSVALHRFLSLRLPGYVPEQHLGGIAYLFVRGMVGAATPAPDGHPYGVFSWRPPAATVSALDHLLRTGGVQ